MNTRLNKMRNTAKGFTKFFIPYLMSRLYSRQFRPILAYLFTEWRCNIDCHYCWDFNNAKEGMDLETAKSSIDWLHSAGCRVVAIMGGEPLLRKDFIVDVTEYGSRKGMMVYLPTNGLLMDRDFVDRIGRAGVSAVNVAVDCVKPKPGLPKAFTRIEKNFRYLVRQQKRYGYMIFFNINITGRNMDDVRKLTEIARADGIGTDYHVCEPPLIEHRHHKHKSDDFFIKPGQLREFDRLIGWLAEKNRQGYAMVNPIRQLLDMKDFVRHRPRQWDCRAGMNGCFIRSDGKIAPCFEMMCADDDWGSIWKPKFDRKKLGEMKGECMKHCLSTCFSTMGHYYDLNNVMGWIFKHGKIS